MYYKMNVKKINCEKQNYCNLKFETISTLQ